jgi:hypothetical protein
VVGNGAFSTESRIKTTPRSTEGVRISGCLQSRLVAWVVRYCRIMLAIVRKPEGQRTFEVLPRRWVVERTLSWLMRWRRLDRDYERLPSHGQMAMIGLWHDAWRPDPDDGSGNRPKPSKPPSKHVLRCCVRWVFTGAQHQLAQGQGATRAHLRGPAYGLSKPLALRVMAL